MRLLNTSTGELQSFFDADIPRYAILSHRWEEDEVSLAEYTSSTSLNITPSSSNGINDTTTTEKIPLRKSHHKLHSFLSLSLRRGYKYCWIGTICIDKSSSAELSEAINAMFEWYHAADVCFVYLSDVTEIGELGGSRWFSRGWTLQELLAPGRVEFFDRNWRLLGERAGLRGIGVGVFSTGLGDQEGGNGNGGEKMRLLRVFMASVAERMSWAARRVTSRAEDTAYCLLGLFRINMPLLYGEGKARAFQRLQFEIMRECDDESIFAWMTDGTGGKRVVGRRANVIAPSPECFLGSSTVTEVVASDSAYGMLSLRKPYEITNQGLRMQVHLMKATVLLNVRARQNQAVYIDVDQPQGTVRETIDLEDDDDDDDRIDPREWLIPIGCKMTHTSPSPLLLRVMQGEGASIPDMMATRTFYRCGRPYSPTASEWQQLITYQQSEPLQKIYLGLRETTRIRDLRAAMSEILWLGMDAMDETR